MTPFQKEWLRVHLSRILKSYRTERDPLEFHHGDCVGSDAEAAEIVREEFRAYKIIGWPSTLTEKRAYFSSDVVHAPFPPLERNRFIVESTDVLLATPKERKETVRSGTWATIRYARKWHAARPHNI